MHLVDVVVAYVAAKNLERPIGRELAPKGCGELRDSVTLFSQHLGRLATTADFDAGLINGFLTALLASGRSPWTVKNRRTRLLMLWRFAHGLGLAPPCSGVRRVHCPELVNDGYSLDQMDTLTRYARQLRGRMRRTGIPKPLWWDSFLRGKWECVLRIGDMLRVEVHHFDPEGWLWAYENKTRKSGWRRLRQSTVASIAACLAAQPDRELIWPGLVPRSAYRAFRQLAERAGVNGTSRYVRRGSSSEFELLHPGAGWQFLRHSSPQVWERHYRVDRICERNAPLPPEIPLAG